MRDAPDARLRRAFEAWRRESDVHDTAYRSVAAAHDQAQALAGRPEMLALRHEAATRAALVRGPVHVKRKVIVASLLFVAAAPLAAWGVERWAAPHAVPAIGERFRTDIGQQADITLPDGSTVTLDTASRLQVSYSDGERRVMLNGQGWFDVKPSARPFVIVAGDRTVTADAGLFDIRADPGTLRAFAAAGQLAIGTGGGSTVPVTAGKLLAVQGETAALRSVGDPLTITGWRQGLLQFDDLRLADAATELNRYRRQPIRIADARAGALRISGSFRTAETPAFVDALTTGFPLRVQKTSDAGIVIASR
jgi:transmembrane sensor